MLVVLLISFKFIPPQSLFLGGGMNNYLSNPYIWSAANFDGEHFLSIAQIGYQPLTYFFFPLYPMLIKVLAGLFQNNLVNYLYSGIFISHASLFIGLVGFYKLLKLDFKEETSKLAIILLLIFPTSFYFTTVYSESLFFALGIWTFYFARKGNFLVSGILTALATATRVVGIALIIPIIYEFWINRKEHINFKNIFGLIISPLGLAIYMYYLKLTTGDWLNFFNTVSIFGEQRGKDLILLPQVFYRYVFKILPNLNVNYFPGLFTAVLEFSIASLFLVILILSFKKIRLSYWLFLLIGYLIPTFSGSFSSLPRYVLVLFPAFIYLSDLLEKNRVLRFVFFVVSLATLAVSLTLFARGYWLS